MPSGYGNQTLYRLSVDYWERDRTVLSKEIKIGFRTIELVEDPIETGGNQHFYGPSIIFGCRISPYLWLS